MGLCIDRSTRFLKNLGYNVVRLPRENIRPLQLIGVQNRDTQQLGGLDLLIRDGDSRELPEILPDEETAKVNGQSSSDLSAAIGLNILGGIIGSMGGNLGIAAKFKAAKTITFEYADVTGDTVVPLEVGRYLRGAEIDVGNKIVEQYVLGNGRLYLITRTLKSKKFRVHATAKSGGELELDIPEIQEVVGGNIEIKREGTRENTVTFEGEKPLVFGFQCLDLGIRDGELSLENTAAGSVAMAADGEPESVILDEEGLLSLG